MTKHDQIIHSMRAEEEAINITRCCFNECQINIGQTTDACKSAIMILHIESHIIDAFRNDRAAILKGRY